MHAYNGLEGQHAEGGGNWTVRLIIQVYCRPSSSIMYRSARGIQFKILADNESVLGCALRRQRARRNAQWWVPLRHPAMVREWRITSIQFERLLFGL